MLCNNISVRLSAATVAATDAANKQQDRDGREKTTGHSQR